MEVCRRTTKWKKNMKNKGKSLLEKVEKVENKKNVLFIFILCMLICWYFVIVCPYAHPRSALGCLTVKLGIDVNLFRGHYESRGIYAVKHQKCKKLFDQLNPPQCSEYLTWNVVMSLQHSYFIFAITGYYAVIHNCFFLHVMLFMCNNWLWELWINLPSACKCGSKYSSVIAVCLASSSGCVFYVHREYSQRNRGVLC